MMDIPASIKAMIEDDTLRDGVFELVEKLNGKKMIADSWDQSRDYAKALGMAAVARSDYVVLMHDIWDATWGAAGALDVGKPDDDEPHDPHTIWNGEENSRYIGLKNPIGDCAHIIPSVVFGWSEGVMLDLHFNDANYAETDTCVKIVNRLTHWEINELEHMEYPFLRSPAVPVMDLHTAVEALSASADEIVLFLKSGRI